MRVRDLADGRAGLDGRDDRRHEIAAVARRGGHAVEPRVHASPSREARRRERAPPAAARSPDRSGTPRSPCLVVGREPVHADDDRFAAVDRLLRAIRRLLNLALNESGLDRASVPPAASIRSMSAAASCSIASVSCSMTYEPPTGSTVFATPVSAAMICCVRSASRAASSVGSPSASSRPLQCSDCVPPSTAAIAWTRDAHDVVVRLLRGQRAAGGLGVKAELLRARVGRAEAVAHDARPQPAGRAELRDLLEEVVVRVEEERQALAELVDVEPGVDRRLHVGDAVGEA